jgi:MurE/MurF fusion protein
MAPNWPQPVVPPGAARLADAAAAVAWLRARLAPGARLCSDSRALRVGDAFLAWPGHRVDARRLVASALQAGAAACLIEADGAAELGFDESQHDERVALLSQLQATCGAIAALWFGHPGHQLAVLATTGTNGKTSTAWWAAQALGTLGQPAGVIGTLGVGVPPQVQATGLTTPDAITLHTSLRAFVDQGLKACAIEASSIGIVEQRLAALPIRVALFTNFTRDHLDYHGSMPAYWAAKRALFDWPGLQAAVINVDDAHGAGLAQELSGTALDVWTVSTAGAAQSTGAAAVAVETTASSPAAAARLFASALRYEARGLAFEVHEGAARASIHSSLVGDYNANNLLVVLGGLRALGWPLAAACAALSQVTAVPGRMQSIDGAGLQVVVDYAHTPDALEKVLAALRPLAAARGGQLIAVFGCGGDRDASKRPLMGAVAARGAQRLLLTSDNPRSEAPGAILAQILAGIDEPARAHTGVVEDRALAIAQAIGQAQPGDVVLLAGKGHEDTQEIAGIKRPFSDLQHAQQALRAHELACAAQQPTGAAA